MRRRRSAHLHSAVCCPRYHPPLPCSLAVMAQQSTLDSSASSSASPSASTARRLHKVPGHFNDARLLAALFTSHTSHTSAPSPPPDGAPREAVEDGGAEGDVGEEKDGGRLVREADAGAEGSQGSPLLPLTRELALIVVRDLRRLWLRRADGLRLRCLMDEQLRPLTPPHPLPLEGGAGDADGDWHGLFLHLLHRLLLRLSGVSASMEQLRLMREQSPLIGRAALRLDTASRRRFLTEPYSLSSPHNSALSPAVLSSMAAFSARQSRGWFSERRNPLAHLRFSTPLAQLDNVPRMPCPHCKRQSATRPHTTQHSIPHRTPRRRQRTVRPLHWPHRPPHSTPLPHCVTR